jgi:hypothetical protein
MLSIRCSDLASCIHFASYDQGVRKRPTQLTEKKARAGSTLRLDVVLRLARLSVLGLPRFLLLD